MSAVADPATGVAVYQTYGGSGWAVYGGTSAAAPIIASTYALAGTPASTDKPASLPYAHTGNLNDVTQRQQRHLLAVAAVHRGRPAGTARPGWARRTAPPRSAARRRWRRRQHRHRDQPGQQDRHGRHRDVSLQISATDSGGASLTYTASGLPTGLSISSSGLISGTPTAAGTFSVTVTATDSTGASGSASFTWTIAGSAVAAARCTGQKLANPGFESGVDRLDRDQRRHQHRRRATRTPAAGYAWLDGYGTTHTDTLSQTVTIPAGCSATLTYYLYINTSETHLDHGVRQA